MAWGQAPSFVCIKINVPRGTVELLLKTHHTRAATGRRVVESYGLSIQIVTGPSFVRSTAISAPNAPVNVGTPSSLHDSARCSICDSARVGELALPKLGRRPFFISALSVNWDTSSKLPPVSSRLLFIFPSSSLKSRSRQSRLAQADKSGVSLSNNRN